MAYFASTYTSMHDLLDKIRVFLLSNGWSVNMWADDATNIYGHSFTYFDYTGGKRLHVQKTLSTGDTIYVNFRSVTEGIIFGDHDSSQYSVWSGRQYSGVRGIGMNVSTGYDAGQPWDTQPGYTSYWGGSAGSVITEIPSSGPNNYWCFQQGDSTYIVVQQSSTQYQYLCFGQIQKSGAWTGGIYRTGSFSHYSPWYTYIYSSGNSRNEHRGATFGYEADTSNFHPHGAMYADIPGRSAGWWNSNSDLVMSAYMPYASSEPGRNAVMALSAYAVTRCPNDFNGLAVLVPIYTFLLNQNSRWSFAGTPEGIRQVNVANYSPASEMTIDSDTWKLFPAFRKETEGSYSCRYNTGFAFLKS